MDPVSPFILFVLLVLYVSFIITAVVAGFMYPIPQYAGDGQQPPIAAHGPGGNGADAGLFAAVGDGNLGQVRTLLNQNLNPEQQRMLLQSVDGNRRTALSYAAHLGHNGVVRYLLNQFPYTMNIQDRDTDQSYPIHQAYRAHFSTLQEFCNYCCTNNSINMVFKQNRLGRTILHLAARERKEYEVGYLLNLPGATSYINIRDTGRKTALDLARSNRVIHLIRSASNST